MQLFICIICFSQYSNNRESADNFTMSQQCDKDQRFQAAVLCYVKHDDRHAAWCSVICRTSQVDRNAEGPRRCFLYVLVTAYDVHAVFMYISAVA